MEIVESENLNGLERDSEISFEAYQHLISCFGPDTVLDQAL